MDDDSLPYVVGSDTSKEAAASMTGSAQVVRVRVFKHIKSQGVRGSTDNEIEHALGLRHQSASARRRELVQRGMVYDSGQRRRTDSGRKAAVWVAAPQHEWEARAAEVAQADATEKLRKAIRDRAKKLSPAQCQEVLDFMDDLGTDSGSGSGSGGFTLEDLGL